MERARSFGSVAELYDRYRPSPPEAAAALLGPLAGRDVVEVAAGTGIVTRFLLSLGARVTAVEPDDQMRAVLARRTPGVRAVAGTAEDLPLRESCADVVVTSSAWHWFAQPAASQEFARVLRDDGRLLILGNGLDRRHAWLDRLKELARAENPAAPTEETRHAREADEDLADPFVDVEGFEARWTWRRTPEQLLGLLQTYSAAIVLGPEERRVMTERVAAEIASAARDGVIDVPMAFTGVRARRRAR